MNLDSIKKRVGTYLASDKRWPIIVDFSNRENINNFVDYFKTESNTIFPADKFCGKDGTFKLEEFLNAIEENEDNVFVVNITAFLKLQGEQYIKKALKNVLSKSISGHVVLVTYQCKNYLKFSDSRFLERNQILFVDGEIDIQPDVCLVAPSLADAFPGCYTGFEKLGMAFEETELNTIFVATDVSKNTFDKAVFNIHQMTNSYDILCSRDSRTKTVPKNYGTTTQWNSALKLMGMSGDWTTVAMSQFDTVNDLHESIKSYNEYSDIQKWYYFIVTTIFGTKKSSYLQYAIYSLSNYKDLPKQLYRAILTMSPSSDEFESYYIERKELLKFFADSLDEAVDYCKVVSSKGENSIYYLTDLTQPEKEKVIDWLVIYGDKYDSIALSKMLKNIYPDLSAYLSKYRFDDALYDNYFETYKYQKVTNKILPSFEVVVEEQAEKLDFTNLLARSSIVDKLNLNNARAYFFDALGVEYLGYIQEKCNQYGLSLNTQIGRCELPSLTEYNKEFIETCENKGCHVTSIKSLDEIKHHGEDDFNYEKVKTPVYLIKELDIINELLLKIRANLYTGNYDKAVVISDHGASRLAVIHETENMWRMATSGVHSGRCCPKNEIDSKPSFAIEADNYWVLANYDRFQGSRKANFEVHGGATLEEVVVPIIEITKKATAVESFILDEFKVVILAAKEFPIIKIYVSVDSDNISIKIGDKYYKAEKTTQKYIYEIKLEDCAKKGIYSFDVLNGNDILSSNLAFEVKKKGFSETSLFD